MKDIVVKIFLIFGDVVGWNVYVINVIIFYCCDWWIKIDVIFYMFNMINKFSNLFKIFIISVIFIFEF